MIFHYLHIKRCGHLNLTIVKIHLKHIQANFTDENYFAMQYYIHDFDHRYQRRYYYLLSRLQNNLFS